ncbi:MAG: hypothetical protein ACHQJ6_00160 [Candidatus Berkiellales bacterium]
MLGGVLNNLHAELDRIDSEYHLFKFGEPGVDFGFYMKLEPLTLHAKAFVLVANGENPRTSPAFQATPLAQSVYIPDSPEEMEKYQDQIDLFLARMAILVAKFNRDAKADNPQHVYKQILAGYIRHRLDTDDKAIIPTAPQPPLVPLLEGSR